MNLAPGSGHFREKQSIERSVGVTLQGFWVCKDRERHPIKRFLAWFFVILAGLLLALALGVFVASIPLPHLLLGVAFATIVLLGWHSLFYLLTRK